MKMLTVSLLVCAMMALIGAAAVTEAEPDEKAVPSDQEKESQIVMMSSRCPNGWTPYNGRCFTYISTPRTWADAEISCQSFGGNLASVHSFGEQFAIQSMIVRFTHAYPLTWLGGYDAAQERTWFWSDGTRFDYTYWDRGQPDNYGNAHCLLMNFGDEKRFDDQPCYYKKPYICAIRS